MTILEELHPTPQALSSERVARISLHSRTPQDFELLLQSGFCVMCASGGSIREFLCIQMGVCGDYTQIRIQTIFLNGKPIDDLDTAIVHAGDHLAFSAAMPGVVGATMRRGGYYASMRESISLKTSDDVETQTGPDCFVHVRLFNFLARELAHIFLRQGVYVRGERFLEFLQKQNPPFFERLGSLSCNDEALPAAALPDHLAKFPTVDAVKIQDNEELS